MLKVGDVAPPIRGTTTRGGFTRPRFAEATLTIALLLSSGCKRPASDSSVVDAAASNDNAPTIAAAPTAPSPSPIVDAAPVQDDPSLSDPFLGHVDAPIVDASAAAPVQPPGAGYYDLGTVKDFEVKKPPPTHVVVTNVEVAGNLPREVVVRVVHNQHASIRNCYEQALKTSPGLAPTIGISFEIDAAGAAFDVSTGAGTIVPSGSALVPCVLGLFRALSFPPPTSGTVHVDYVFELKSP